MKAYHIVQCCHLLTVQESGDQSLTSVFHAVIIPWLFLKKKNIHKKIKAVILTVVFSSVV